MSEPVLELEGLWEEVTARLPDLAGRRVRLIVLTLEEDQTIEAGAAPHDPRLTILQEIDARSRMIVPKPEPADYLREGRDGANGTAHVRRRSADTGRSDGAQRECEPPDSLTPGRRIEYGWKLS
jgi:hypothetical protein